MVRFVGGGVYHHRNLCYHYLKNEGCAMEKIKTKNPRVTLRFATLDDTGLVLSFIKKLAEYENMSDDVEATEERLADTLFTRNVAEVIIGEYDERPVGFMLFFHNFSTFVGKPGIYLEDIFVDVDMRGNGFGKIMLSYLAELAIERDCGRLEWACLDWNEPSIEFYKSLGAVHMDEWTGYRLTGEKIKSLAEG